MEDCEHQEFLIHLTFMMAKLDIESERVQMFYHAVHRKL